MTDAGPAPRLRPREHGAYAMLAFPLLSGLLVGGVSWAGVAFAVLAVTGFLAHESVLIVLGRRGERLKSGGEAAARERLSRLGLVALVAGILFAGTAPGAAWGAALLSGLLAAAVGGLLVTGGTRTLAGELLVGAAFASVHGVLAASGRAGAASTYLPVVAWTGSFALATLAVHSLKYRFRNRGPGAWAVTAAPTLAGTVVLLVALALLAPAVVHPATGAAAVAVLPKALAVLALAYLTIHPRQLKRVGWTLVATDTATLILLVVAFRLV